MVAVGIPPLSANITNTVALSPGYFGGALSQRSDLDGQKQRLKRLLPIGAIGGVLGGVLLLATDESLFRALVPFLILGASLLLAFQPRIQRAIAHHGVRSDARTHDHFGTVLATFAASAYGGYFGAGLGIILLAAMGITVEESFTRVSALKQVLSLTVNVAAADLLHLLGSSRVECGSGHGDRELRGRPHRRTSGRQDQARSPPRLGGDDRNRCGGGLLESVESVAVPSHQM